MKVDFPAINEDGTPRRLEEPHYHLVHEEDDCWGVTHDSGRSITNGLSHLDAVVLVERLNVEVREAP